MGLGLGLGLGLGSGLGLGLGLGFDDQADQLVRGAEALLQVIDQRLQQQRVGCGRGEGVGRACRGRRRGTDGGVRRVCGWGCGQGWG